MTKLLESFTKYGVCILINAAFVYFIGKGIVYPSLFELAVLASWGVLGLTEYSKAQDKNKTSLREEIASLREEIGKRG